MGDILTTADFDMVRNAIGVDSSDASDAVLGSAMYLGIIEIGVKLAITDWAVLKAAAGADWTALQVGTGYLLAARYAKLAASGETGGFTIGQYKEEKSAIDWSASGDEMIRLAREALSMVSTRVWTRHSIALAYGPTSSGYNVPDEFEDWVAMVTPPFVTWNEDVNV